MTRRVPTPPPTPRSLVGVSTDRHRRVIREVPVRLCPGTKNASNGKRTGNRRVPPIRHPPVLTQHPAEAGKLSCSRPRTPPIDSVTRIIIWTDPEDTDFFVTTGPCNEDTCAIGPIVRQDAIQPPGMGGSRYRGSTLAIPRRIRSAGRLSVDD